MGGLWFLKLAGMVEKIKDIQTCVKGGLKICTNGHGP